MSTLAVAAVCVLVQLASTQDAPKVDDVAPLAPESAAPSTSTSESSTAAAPPIEPRETPKDSAPASTTSPAKPSTPTEPEVVDEPAPQPPRVFLSSTKASFGARFGASAGNVLAVPFFVPGPGVYASASQRFTFFEVGFVDAELGLSMGISSEGDVTSLLGYRGKLGGGFRLLFNELYIDVDAHFGLTSVILIPTPRMGLGLELGWIVPFAGSGTFDLVARTDLDVLIVLPAPSASLETGVSWKAGPIRTRLRVGVDGEALILILSNTLSASVYATLTGALELP